MTVQVLFVCLGNICRSPTAHAVFLQKVRQAGLSECIRVDSAGTAAWHIGKSPDARSVAAGRERGYDLSALRARQAVVEDFEQYDYVLAMDDSNLANLKVLRSEAAHARTEPELFLATYLPGARQNVPDPYYGGSDGFEEVLDLVEAACDNLLATLLKEHPELVA